MAITYKTVIAQAIQHFNDVQTALHDVGAKYNGKLIDAFSSSATLLPTEALDTIITGQLQLKAVDNIELAEQTGTDVSAFATASVRDAAGFSLAISNNEGDGSDVTIGKLVSGYYPVSNTVKGTVSASTAGWFTGSGELKGNSAIVGRIAEAKFDVFGNVVYCKTAGYVPKGSETSGLGTIAAGSVTSSAEITSTTLKAGSNGINLLKTAPNNGTAELDYFTLRPYAEASSSMTLNAGYITETGTEGSASETTKATYYVNASKETASTIGSYSFTPTLSNPKGTDGEDTQTSGNVKLVAATGAIVTEEPTSGYYLKLETNSDSGAISSSVTVSEGYTKDETTYTVSPTDNDGVATNNVVVEGTTNYVKIQSGSVDVTNSEYSIADDEQNFKIENGVLTVTGSTTKTISLKKTEGYIDGEPENSTTPIKLSNSKVIDLKGEDPNLSADNIRFGIEIFGVTGTFIPPIGENGSDLEDAKVEHMLIGYKAYDEDGKLLVGTMNDYSLPDTDKNGAGGQAQGKEIGSSTTTGFLPTLINNNGTYRLKSFVKNTGYVKANETYMTSTVPTQTKVEQMPTSNEAVTFESDDNGLLSKVTINPMDDATWNDAKITAVKGTKLTDDISDAENIQSHITVNPSTVSGYMFKVKLEGSAAPTTNVAGYAEAGGSNGTVSIDNTMSFKITESSLSTYLTDDSTAAHSATAAVGKGYVGKDYYVKKGEFTENGVSGSVSVTNNDTSPKDSGDLAKVYEATDTNKENDYVLIKATGSATGNKVDTAGWFSADPTGTTVTGLTDFAIIKAAINPDISANCTNATSTIYVGTATTFNETTGAATAGDKSNTGDIDGDVLGSSADLQDKYIIGGATASGRVSGTATADINDDATGEAVDTYVEALFKRMLGKTYTAVEKDPVN